MQDENGDEIDYVDEGSTLDKIHSTVEAMLVKFLESHCRGMPQRDELLRRVRALTLPANPLDEIVHLLGGPGEVA
jgi:hypothetical protein